MSHFFEPYFFQAFFVEGHFYGADLEPPPEPEPEAPAVSTGGSGGGWRGRGGAALGVKERRRISKMVDEAFAKLYGVAAPAAAEVKEAVVAAVEQDLAPLPVLDIEALARVHRALVDLQNAINAQVEDEAEVLALLNLIH